MAAQLIDLNDYSQKWVIKPTSIPAAVVDVAAFVRVLFEPVILEAIESVQEETCDE